MSSARQAEQPAFPVYPLTRQLKLRQDLVDRYVYCSFENQLLDSGVFTDLLQQTAQVLVGVCELALRSTLEVFRLQLLTQEKLQIISWRLAGNYQELRQGLVVVPWQVPTQPEWYPAQVIHAEIAHRKTRTDRQKGAQLRWQILAGSAAGMTTSRWLSDRFLHAARANLGFARFNRPMEPGKRVQLNYESPLQLFGLRGWLLVSQESCRDAKLGFERLCCHAQLRQYNQRLLRSRLRLDKPCTYGFQHACHRCPVGLDSCQLATHPRLFFLGRCPACQQDRQRIDPDGAGLCQSCLYLGKVVPDPLRASRP